MSTPAATAAPGTEAWSVPAEELPGDASPAERLAFCVRQAILAPSSRNSQPWLFRRHGEALELLADRSRALPVGSSFRSSVPASRGSWAARDTRRSSCGWATGPRCRPRRGGRWKTC